MSTDTQNDNASAVAEGESESSVTILPFATSRLLPLGITFALGALITTFGWLYWQPKNVFHQQPPSQQPITTEQLEPLEESVAISPSEQFAQDILSRPLKEAISLADETLLSSDIETAQEFYKQLLGNSHGQFRQDLQYRIAVCCELLGNADEAFESYERVTTDNWRSGIQQAAQLGISRTRIRAGNYRSASSQLCQTVLRMPSTAGREALRGEAWHLLAYCRFRDAVGDSSDLLEDEQLAVVPPDWNPRHLLKLAEQTSISEAQAGATKTPVEVLHRYGELPNNVYLRIHAHEIPLVELLREISRQSELNITWTSEQEGRLNDRVLNLSVDSMNLALLLDCLLTPLEMTWGVGSSGVGIASTAKASDREWSAEPLLRALHYATVTFPQHPYAASALIQLAHVNFLLRKTDDAVSYFTQFLEQFSRSPGKREVWFNLAKIRYHQTQTSEAIDALYRVIDYGKEHPLAATAQLFIGRLHLELGSSARAIKPLASALSLANKNKVRVKSTIMLASAYALEKQYGAAIRVFHENRNSQMSEKDRAAALLVDRYAKFSVASSQQTNQAGTMLIMSLTQVQPDHFLGSYGYILLGRIYREIGLEEQMAQMYRKGIEREKQGLLHDKMMIELADYAYSKGDLLSAETLLSEIVENEASPIYIQVEMRLAQISFKQKENARCLHLCNKVAQQKNTIAKPEALRMMGQVYQRLQDYDRASMCFAGILPGQRDLQSGYEHKDVRVE